MRQVRHCRCTEGSATRWWQQAVAGRGEDIRQILQRGGCDKGASCPCGQEVCRPDCRHHLLPRGKLTCGADADPSDANDLVQANFDVGAW